MKITYLILLIFSFIITSCQVEKLDEDTNGIAGQIITAARKVSHNHPPQNIGIRCNEIKHTNSVQALTRATNFQEVLSCKYDFNSDQKLFLSQPISISPEPSCGSDGILGQIDQQAVTAVENRLTNLRQQRSSGSRSIVETVYTLPLVFHVVHTGESVGTGHNISNEQIFTAVEELNNHFRKVSGTHGYGNGVDTKLQFALAVRDPDGNSTNGIVRVDGSGVENYVDLGIESVGKPGADETAIKNLSKWNQDEYINIWVVNKIGGSSSVQGYAYFPTTNTNDGIVMKNSAVGTMGTVSPIHNKSTVLTHEVGHYFALYHTFYNSNDCQETNCESQGDRVCDTPVTTLNGSCSNPACAENPQPQNVSLYMDYTGQSCKNEFSQGQKDRMRDALVSERPGLISSLGLQPVATNDVALIAVNQPSQSVCNANQPINLNVGNYGQNTITGFNLKVKRNGSTVYNQTVSTNISPGSSLEINPGNIYIASGSFNYEFIVSSPNGVSDENSNNNSITKTIIRNPSNVNLALQIQLDYFGAETSWTMKNGQGQTIQSGGPFQNNAQGTIVSENICISQGCYVFTMHDEFGDGQSFISGNYQLTDNNGVTLAEGENDWGEQKVHNFCINESSPSCYSADDIQVFTDSFGTSNNLQYDSNGDGMLTSVDLLEMLANYCGN